MSEDYGSDLKECAEIVREERTVGGRLMSGRGSSSSSAL